jgi:aminoglycoside 6'-N-acetyltransferase
MAGSPAIVLRPLAEGDEAELRRIHETPEVARWWGRPDEGFPWDEPEVTRLTIEVDGRVAGMIEFSEELEPRYRHAGIDPATANAAAIRAYEKVGFRRVGVMRRYEREVEGEGWHDGLLMELLASKE